MAHELHLLQLNDGETIEAAAARVLEPLGPDQCPAPMTSVEQTRRGHVLMHLHLAAPMLTERDLELEATAMGITDERALCRLQRVEMTDNREVGTGITVSVHPRHVTIAVADTPPDGPTVEALDIIRRMCDSLARRADMRIFNPLTGREAAISNEPGALLIEPGGSGRTVEGNINTSDAPPAAAHPEHGTRGVVAFVPRGRSPRQRAYENARAKRGRWAGTAWLLALPAVAAGLGLLPFGRTNGRPNGWMFAGIAVVGALSIAFVVAAVLMWRQDRRRRSWRRRGACLECGYSRKGLDEAADCPECGAPSAYV